MRRRRRRTRRATRAAPTCSSRASPRSTTPSSTQDPLPDQGHDRAERRAAADDGRREEGLRGVHEPEPRAARGDGLLEDADGAARGLHPAGGRLPRAPRHHVALGHRQLLRRRPEVRGTALRAPQRLRAVGRPRQAPPRSGRVAGDARGDARLLPRAVRPELPGVGGRGDEPLLHPAALAQVRGAGVRDTVGQGRARAEPVREARRRSLARLHRAALLPPRTPTPRSIRSR